MLTPPFTLCLCACLPAVALREGGLLLCLISPLIAQHFSLCLCALSPRSALLQPRNPIFYFVPGLLARRSLARRRVPISLFPFHYPLFTIHCLSTLIFTLRQSASPTPRISITHVSFSILISIQLLGIALRGTIIADISYTIIVCISLVFNTQTI